MMYAMMPMIQSAWKPFCDLDQMRKDFLITHSVRGFRTDVKETDDAYILEAELPGFDKNEISISVQNDQLTIKAEHKSEENREDSNGNYLRRERYYGSFCRSYDVSQIEANQITASYENGILKLQMPKKYVSVPETTQIPID